MNANKWSPSFRALGASKSGAAWSGLLGRVVLASLIALPLLAVGTIAVSGHARAASGSPKIVFTAPIYAGQNNGFAEGPVGTWVSFRGSGWMPAGIDTGPVTLTLADEQGDTPGQSGSACLNGAPQIAMPFIFSQYGADGNGTITSSFFWPIDASTTGHTYWACGKQKSLTAAGVSKFKVLSPNPPTVLLDVSQAAPGSNVTVTGHNWLPGGVQVNVLLAPCVNCSPPFYTRAQVTSQPDGFFSTLLQVPPDAPIGTILYVSASNVDPSNSNNNGALAVASELTRLTVGTQTAPAPTATSVATPAPTATSAATPAPTATNTAHTSGTDGNSSTTVLIALLVSLNVILLMVAILLLLLFLRSRGSARRTPRGDDVHAPLSTMYSDSSSSPNPNPEYAVRSQSLSGPLDQGWLPAGAWWDNSQEPAAGESDASTSC